VRTAAAIFAIVAGLTVLGLMAWTLAGMVRSRSRRSNEQLGRRDDAGSESRNGSDGDPWYRPGDHTRRRTL